MHCITVQCLGHLLTALAGGLLCHLQIFSHILTQILTTLGTLSLEMANLCFIYSLILGPFCVYSRSDMAVPGPDKVTEY